MLRAAFGPGEDRKLTAARELADTIDGRPLRDNVRAKLSLVLLGDGSEIGHSSDYLIRRLETEMQREDRQLLAQMDLLRELLHDNLIRHSDVETLRSELAGIIVRSQADHASKAITS